MQWLKKSKVKIMIGLLAISIGLSGSPLKANEIQKIDSKSDSTIMMLDTNQEEAIKIRSINEMNWYMSKMNPSELAATLKFFRVAEMVHVGYVNDASIESLMTGAIKGTVSSIADPYSVYMDAKMYENLKIETKGFFGGVGIILGSKDNVLTVVAPVEGTPSATAGILSGDQIIKIDGKETNGLAIDEAVNLIRGTAGTTVVLTIKRGDQENQEYQLVRANIQIKTVSSKMLEHHIGYIRISMFNEHTGEDFSTQFKELEQQGMEKLILDLRNNPGGLLEECIKVANYLVPQGPIVSIVGKDGTQKTNLSDLEKINYPLVVLVNGGSASASEIVAGAVQDTKAGTLIGTQTFGKGSVQTVLNLGDSSAVKLTIAKYATPNGRFIHGVGIAPDLIVDMPEFREKGQDVQLEKAIEVLTAEQ